NGARGLAKALIQGEAAGAAGNMRQDAIEDDPAALGFVEPEIEKLAQEPAALRGAERVGVFDLTGTRVALGSRPVAEKFDEITRRKEPQADHRRTFRCVHDPVVFSC